MKPEDAIKHGEEAAFRDYIERQAKALGLLPGVYTPIPEPSPTKRELFAANALCGLLSNPEAFYTDAPMDVVQKAVELADALIAALAKEHASGVPPQWGTKP